MQIQGTYKEIWSIALPIILGGIAQTVLGVTDTAFLARVGEAELAASAIAGVFYFTLIMVATGFSIGAQILMSRKAGEGDKVGIAALLNQSFLLLFIIGVVMFFVAHFFAPLIFPLIIHDSHIAQLAVTYVLCRSYGLLIFIPSLSARAFLVASSRTKLITIQSVLMCALNTLLGYAMIFGKWGFPPTGIAGAGIAAAISEIIAAMMSLAVIKFGKNFREFRLLTALSFNKKIVGDISNMSAPIVAQNLLSMGAWFIFFVLIEKLGQHNLAISNVIRASYMIMMTPVWGFSSASNSMTSNLIGQNRQNEIFQLLKKNIALCCITIFPVCLLLAAFPHLLLNIITNDTVLITHSLHSFYIICFATCVLAVSLSTLSAVAGTGATKAAMVIELVNIAVYMSYITICCLVLKTSVETVWLSEITYWSLMGIFSYIYLKSERWKKIIV